MKRLWIGAMAIGMLVLMTLPAVATPPDGHGNPHETTTTVAGGLAGTTCGEEAVPDENGVFTIELTGADPKDGTCLDVWADEGEWTVDVAINAGTMRRLLIIPRDSVGPGDSCGGYDFRRNVPSTFVLPGPNHPMDLDGDGFIEGSYVNSCGTQFGEWVDGYADPIFSVDESIPSPLALIVLMEGSRDADVTLTVHLP